ncbi:unnamed protein product [Absidia cylindrospora]
MSLGQLPAATDFSATWNYLEQGLDQIMNCFDEGLTSVRYTLLYSAVHNFCARSHNAMTSSSIGSSNPH